MLTDIAAAVLAGIAGTCTKLMNLIRLFNDNEWVVCQPAAAWKLPLPFHREFGNSNTALPLTVDPELNN